MSSTAGVQEVRVASFMDIELVSLEEAELPDAYRVAFDVIYAGETWCRSLVVVSAEVAASLDLDERAAIRAARDALLDLLAVETAPVSFHLRLAGEGCMVLARGHPGS